VFKENIQPPLQIRLIGTLHSHLQRPNQTKVIEIAQHNKIYPLKYFQYSKCSIMGKNILYNDG